MQSTAGQVDAETGRVPFAVNPLAAAIGFQLLSQAADLPDLVSVMTAFAGLIRSHGTPLDRVSLHLRLLDPRIRGITYIWTDAGVEVIERVHGIEFTPTYQQSPMYSIIEEDSGGIRVRLDRVSPPYQFPIIDELVGAGFTDYAAVPMVFSDGRRQVATVATRRAGGFSVSELALLADTMPALAMLVEVRGMQQVASSLMRTYVGARTGARILAGEIRRGTGITMPAVLWYCDLQGFTPLADRLPLHQLIALLNNYFEIMGGAVQAEGGEILKFIGDAMLAIFPIEDKTDITEVAHVSCRAMAAAEAAMAGMVRLNAERQAWGQPALGGGIALHLGDVMYGNIGAPDRLDFTVIGPAVNLVSRLQGLTRRMQRPLLTSAAFAHTCQADPPRLLSLGFQPVRGLTEPVEVFGLAG